MLTQTPPQTFGPGYPPAFPPALGAKLRVTRNLQALGILWCVFGAYRILGGLIGMFFLRAVATHGFGDGSWPFGHHGALFPPTWMGFLVPVVASVTVVSATLAFITAFGLLGRRSWGRTLAIIAAVLALLKFPLGTALGIYTLWVLAPGESGLEYDSISTQAAQL